MMDEYKERFVAFLEGLEMQNIDDFIELPIEDIRLVSKTMRNLIDNPKTHELISDLENMFTLFKVSRN